jgi:hypothetical protein
MAHAVQPAAVFFEALSRIQRNPSANARQYSLACEGARSGCRAGPRSAYTGAAHEDRDWLLPNAIDIDRGRRRNTSNTTKPTERRQTPCNFSQSRSLPRGGSDPSADAWGETPRRLHTFWHNFGAWPRKRVLYTALTRRSRVQRRALPDFKDFITAQDHGRRLQDEDDEPHFTPGDAALPFGLLASATSRLPSAHALTPSGLPQGFALLQRLRMRCQGSRTTAASYRHTWVAQAPPGRCTVAALHPSPSSPTCGNHRHTWFVCFGVFVCKCDFRMATARATAAGIHRLIGTRWLLKVSTPRRGLKTRCARYDG